MGAKDNIEIAIRVRQLYIMRSPGIPYKDFEVGAYKEIGLIKTRIDELNRVLSGHRHSNLADEGEDLDSFCDGVRQVVIDLQDDIKKGRLALFGQQLAPALKTVYNQVDNPKSGGESQDWFYSISNPFNEAIGNYFHVYDYFDDYEFTPGFVPPWGP